MKSFGGHDSKITSICISPHLADFDLPEAYRAPIRFATTSFDKTLKMWEFDELSDI